MANFLTVLRIIVCPFFVWAMVLSNSNSSYRYVALALFMFGAVTDWADGFVARHTNTVSKFGVTADPLADRIFIGTTIVTLYAMRILPLVFLIIVLGRDVLMALGYPLIGKIDPSKVAVHWTGKVATATLFAGLSCLVMSPAPHTGGRVGFSGFQFSSLTSWQTYGLWLFAIGMCWSIVSAGIYVSRVIELLREEKGEGKNSGAGDPAP